MNSSSVRLGVVGLGRWARVLTRAAAKSDKLKIVAAYSRSLEKRHAFEQECGVPAAPDLRTLLADAEIQGVVLTVPNEQHLPLATEAAQAGKHVYTEKPIAGTLEEGLEIASLEQKYGITVTVGHSARLMAGIGKIREAIGTGELGRLAFLEANFSNERALELTPKAWRWYKDKAPGGPLSQLAIHQFDVLHYLGGEILEGEIPRITQQEVPYAVYCPGNCRGVCLRNLKFVAALFTSAFTLACLFALTPAVLAAQQQSESSNMELIGSNDLQDRSAYQPTIHKQGDRWIAYIGHHGGSALNPLNGQTENNGTSIVDVTDPAHPAYLAHIPGEPGKAEAGGAQMTRVCDGSLLPRADKSKVYLLRSFGNSAHEIWDETDPAKPSLITVVLSGLRDTHKSWWECDTGIAYLVAGDPAWRTRRMTKIYDLSDPAKPVFIRDFGLPGQQPGSTGPVHGPISTGSKGNRIYFAYGPGQAGIVQIVDRQKLLNGPREPSEQNLLYPQIARVDFPIDTGAHTAFPLLGVDIAEFAKMQEGKVRDFLVVAGESLANECLEARQMVHILDITTEASPFGVATWTVPESSGNFCSRGGRFGTHSSNESFTPVYYKRVMFFAHFNAGVRAVDVRDPYHLREIAYYIPAVTDKTDKRCVGAGADQRCKVAIQTNNVEVDDRGYIYIVDRANTGLHILRLTGPARAIANLP